MVRLKQTVTMALLAACIGFADASHAAIQETVTYGFDFEVTSDTYRQTLSGALFTKGTHGSGTTTFMFQPVSVGETIVSEVNASYIAPFTVDITFDGNSLRLIDSSVIGLYDRRGIIVQDIPSSDVTYDTVLFEGFSGPVEINDEFGTPVTRQLHTQIGLFALSNTITDYALSESNLQKILSSLIDTSFNIKVNGGVNGQVNGVISNFRMVPNTVVPAPETWILMVTGFTFFRVLRWKRTSANPVKPGRVGTI
ncbi:hypothetical protein [Methylomonas rivi]|uniref:PEP-CTERM protein-sorting domain-containing protein n=1 Tax=Methylomonas rivi TaxID=2952226 RepID=A0ABT1U559_9GAMM|nr:hypothetical protein [Methylomonas sp. WSC-6]MCQ8128992.1 hypothetical protein [Methylomonas sp. WSC-6]